MFSHNAPAESCSVSCGLSFPLSAPVSSQEVSRPQNMSYSLKLSGKPTPTNGPGWKVSTRWLWIFQRSKEAETAPDPSPVVAPREGTIIGQARMKRHSPMGRKPALLWLGENRGDEGEGKSTPSSRGASLWAARMDISHRSVRLRSVPGPGPSSSFSWGTEGPYPSPESSKSEKEKGSNWAQSTVSKDFWITWPCFNSQL